MTDDHPVFARDVHCRWRLLAFRVSVASLISLGSDVQNVDAQKPFSDDSDHDGRLEIAATTEALPPLARSRLATFSVQYSFDLQAKRGMPIKRRASTIAGRWEGRCTVESV